MGGNEEAIIVVIEGNLHHRMQEICFEKVCKIFVLLYIHLYENRTLGTMDKVLIQFAGAFPF